jgi:phage tail sheath gpL-like
MLQMELQGLLQNVAAFIADVTCAINSSNPDRIDILFPPPLIGQLRTMAISSQFRTHAPPGTSAGTTPSAVTTSAQ